LATVRTFAYNSGTGVTGTTQVGYIAAGATAADYGGGLTWWKGPDEDPGYVICHTSGARTAGQNSYVVPAPTIGFWRSALKTEASFISLCNGLFNQGFVNAGTALSWLNANGYWASYDINAQGFSYSNFASTTGLVGVGNTSVSSNIYFLTTAAASQIGNVYRTTAIQYNRNFSAQWSTFIGGGSGADGYCIQWTPTNNTNGSSGGGVGYVSTAINAITFLTYINNSYNWYKNNVLQVATSVSSGFWRQTLYFWGDYNHSAQTFALYYSTTNSKPGSANKTFTNFVFDTGSYYMGFGAATGGANDNHELLSWVLTFT
jgi:hypothetical protein